MSRTTTRIEGAFPRFFGRAFALLVLLLPSTGEAVSYVKSVEYVELTMGPGSTTSTVNLTKGQIVSNAVPFASLMVTGSDGDYDEIFTDVFFQTAPSRVTVQRATGSGTVSVGVFVVEFDAAHVNVHQGTFSMGSGITTTSAAIAAVDLTRTALVSYSRNSSTSDEWRDYAVAGWFSAATQLSWQRESGSGTVNGHYFVFEAAGSEFRVQAVSFNVPDGGPSGTATITAVDADKTFIIASYRTIYDGDDNQDGQVGIYLQNPTTVRAERQWVSGDLDEITDIRAFVVELGGDVRVQRGALSYTDTDVQRTASIQSVDPSSTMVWNGSSIGPGAIQSANNSGALIDTAFQRLKLANETTVQADRDGICEVGEDCEGIGHFEVVEWSPSGAMRVKSGFYTGDGNDDRPIFVGFQPDVVVVKRDVAGTWGVLRTSTMAGDAAKSLDNAGLALFADAIQSFTSGGFTIGTHAGVNAVGDPYYWVAFEVAPGELAVGTYTGNNADNRSIASVGFQPEILFILPAGGGAGGTPLYRSSTMTGDTSYDFDATEIGPPANAIQAFEMDGFQVGSRASTNGSGQTFHYIAWNAVPGRTAVGTYVGDGADGRPIDQAGFQPEWVVVKQQGDSGSLAQKPASTGVSTDDTLALAGFAGAVNLVQVLRPLGFEVGGDSRVNGSTLTYHWMAFGPHLPQVNYRSIGTAAPYGTGSVALTAGSTDVTGTGTAWVAQNRGRGDVITVPCPDPPTCTGGTHYQIAAVSSNDALRLHAPYAGTTGSGLTYLIRRQFTTLAAWENCVDGGPCAFFPVASSSLVSDDRSEVGIAYKDSAFVYAGSAIVEIDGSVTDAAHAITLTADHGNRHYGMLGTGVILDLNGAITDEAMTISDDFVTVEWLELRNAGDGGDGFEIDGMGSPNQFVLRYNLIHHMTACIQLQAPNLNADIYNNIIHDCEQGINIDTDLIGSPRIRIFNNTVFRAIDSSFPGITASGVGPYSSVLLRNNISHSNPDGDFGIPGIDAASSHNLSSDASGTAHSPAGGGIDSVSLAAMSFVSTTPGTENLHIQAGSAAQDAGTDLTHLLSADIDGGSREVAWEIGADDIAATTEVELLSFEARGAEASIALSWRTGSELRNLGFHLYRGPSPGGPFHRVTTSLIPGLGSSPEGARYEFRDSPLSSGTTYYYLLEAVETTGRIRRHGPVSATPAVPGGPSGGREPAAVLTYGDPAATSLRILSSGAAHVEIELVTGGFLAIPRDDGSVGIEIPGFAPAEGDALVPVKRHWIEAVAGRNLLIESVRIDRLETFALRPTSFAEIQLEASRDGTQRLRRSRAGDPLSAAGLVPAEPARIAAVAFQGDTKKALLELAPLRWDASSGRLVFARRLVVTIAFRGREPSEIASSDGRRGRRESLGARTRRRDGGVAARLVVRERGLHAVRYEEIFGSGRRRGVRTDSLRLSRLGSAVAFHVEPGLGGFAPGSTLFFFAEGGDVNPYDREAVYELEVGARGTRMPIASAAPTGHPLDHYWERVVLEEDRYYQAALLAAPDRWLWEMLLAPAVNELSFFVTELAPSKEPPRLEVFLQGASDFPSTDDHRVRLFVNGVLVGEEQWNGKEPRSISVQLPPGVLRSGENRLAIENAGSGAPYSMVFLDRFAVLYPRRPVAEEGSLEGAWDATGAATVQGLGAGALVLEMSGPSPRWLTGHRSEEDAVRFHVESGRSYLAVGRDSVRRPDVRRAAPVRWRKEREGVDYLVIGPEGLLAAAQPLLDHRREQGLRVAAVPLEEVFDEMGFGERRPEALRELISYAYHHWRGGIRYVLLLGDASYDFKDHLGTGTPNVVPALPFETTYLWTVSDPALASVNGDDLLPDVAIGRLPAADAGELRVMVDKILAYEAGGGDLRGSVVLVTDDPDAAGDFDRDAEDLANTVFAGRPVHRISLRELGVPAAREAIVEAFDRGASLLSYVGHGGIHLWASENLFSTDSLAQLAPQSRQPLTLALDCLNGYFHFPYFDSLAEELLKAEAKGAIAVIAPSGLSSNGPAHLLHRALAGEVLQGRHPRLGDAVLKAQEGFLQTGALPELLALYHLFGDPALVLR